MTLKTWDGAGDGVTWESDANWGGDTFPQDNNDQVLIDSTADVITTAGVITIGELSVTSGFSGSLTLGGALTVDDAGTENGNWFWDGGTFDANNFDLNIDGNANPEGGTVVFGAGSTWTVNGNWDSNGSATLTEETSTILMTGTSVTIVGGTSSAKQLATIEIDTGATVSAAGSFRPATLNVNGTLTMSTGNRAQVTTACVIGASGSLTGAGELRVTSGGSVTVGSGTITSAIMSLEGNVTINPGTYGSAAITMKPASSGTRTLTFAAGTFIFTNTITFETNASSGTYNVDMSTNNPAITFNGNVIANQQGTAVLGWLEGSGALTFGGTSGTQTIDVDEAGIFGAVVIDASGAIKQLISKMTFVTLTVTAGTFELSGNDLERSVSGAVVNDATIKLQGDETLTSITNLDTNTGTVIYTGTNVVETLTLKDFAYFNLTIDDGNGTKATFQAAAGTLTVNGVLNITSNTGTFTNGTNNSSISIAGNVTIDPTTYTKGTGTITLTGSSGTQTITFNGNVIEDIDINGV